jgi:lipopolysaccharide transport system ATP-binding protein
LLNIICGRLQPTSGSVTVNGTTQALMDMGTGFHPEFTGRDNIISALAYQGVTGRAAKERLDDIVDFSELADFIDQPVKTYSSGMYARLAFSTATAISPDILVVDEILGAGDAYFAAKCAERMRRLTRDSGATVLFVSHDMGAVQRICERAVWIDRGRLRMEGPTLDISKSYYADVLAREEGRLRAQTTAMVKRMRRRVTRRVGRRSVWIGRPARDGGARQMGDGRGPIHRSVGGPPRR